MALNYLKRNSKITEVSVDDCLELVSEEDSLEISYIQEEQKIKVHRALRKLNPEYRQVL